MCIPKSIMAESNVGHQNAHIQTDGDNPLHVDPETEQGSMLVNYLINELALDEPAPDVFRDELFVSLCSCVSDMINEYPLQFRELCIQAQNEQDFTYREYEDLAHGIFSQSPDSASNQLEITWKRIISLFAATVSLAKVQRNDPIKLSNVRIYVTDYISKFVAPFVREHGGWNAFLDHFPPPVDEEWDSFKTSLVYFSVCVGIGAVLFLYHKCQ